MQLKVLFFACFCSFFTEIIAQEEPISIGVIDFYLPSRSDLARANRNRNLVMTLLEVDGYRETTSEVRQYQDYVVENFTAYKKFTLVERQQLDLIREERELQKSEDFIDGLVVEQGKSIGAQYLLFGDYDPYTRVLTITLYSVENQEVAVKKNIPLQIATLNSHNAIKRRIKEGVAELIFRHFSPKIKLIRALQGNEKRAKRVLIAGGSKYNFVKQQYLFVHRLSVEDVDGEQLERMEKIGEIMVVEIENENFSQCVVKDGGAAIQTALNSGDKLYCTVWLRDK